MFVFRSYNGIFYFLNTLIMRNTNSNQSIINEVQSFFNHCDHKDCYRLLLEMKADRTLLIGQNDKDNLTFEQLHDFYCRLQDFFFNPKNA